ncbi:MAG: peptide-methionine (S)-S-oxide reductase MsrA [Candidatus Omnitrophica bacterium]|nr:peptide-methionine (S)-S-oxide reductase MsrA [Candidatus Omnitrophota bacterium]
MITLLWQSPAWLEAEKVKDAYEKAVFAGGCFWGMEKYFSEEPGVVSARVGYTGGRTADPSYEEVCTGLTGHAEAIEITYDPSKISYDDLLAFFFRHHDPTTLNRQGPDVGTQYRSAIFFHTPAQRVSAEAAKAALDRSGFFKRPIVTEIKLAGSFYPAEDYHQDYLKKNPRGYCSIQVQSETIGQILRSALKKDKG